MSVFNGNVCILGERHSCDPSRRNISETSLYSGVYFRVFLCPGMRNIYNNFFRHHAPSYYILGNRSCFARFN